jgi:valyl-tRNA synthetase
VLDPDRKKMSKSKGNVVTPMGLLEEHGADGVRYWAASARPGTDTAFDTGQMKVGRRLSMKFLNAAKFILAKNEPRGAITHALDAGVLANLQQLVRESTEHLESYDYAWVLQRTETFFWDFCDNYLELAKARRYGDFGAAGAASANAAMLLALSALNRLFAPFLPFVTDEVWSWWQPGSVHAAPWPDAGEIAAVVAGQHPGASGQYLRVSEVLGEIRKRKAEARLSPAAPLARVHLRNNEELERSWPAEVVADLKAAARAEELVFITDATFDVAIEPQERTA